MRGVFAYPPGGHVPWHTNVLSEPGFRAYFSYHLPAPPANATTDGEGWWAREVRKFYNGGAESGGAGRGGGDASFRWFDYREGLNRELPLQHGDVVVFAAERRQPLWHTTHSDGITRVSLGLRLPAEEVAELYNSGALLDARQFANIKFD